MFGFKVSAPTSAMYRYAMLHLLIYLMMSCCTGIAVTYIRLPPTTFYVPVLEFFGVDDISQHPRLGGVLMLLLCIPFTQFGLLAVNALWKKSEWEAAMPPLREETHDALLRLLPWIWGYVLIAAGVWIPPWADQSIDQVLIGVLGLLTIALFWAGGTVWHSKRQMRHRRERAVLHRPLLS